MIARIAAPIAGIIIGWALAHDIVKTYARKGRHRISTVIDTEWEDAIRSMAQRRNLNARYGIGG